jgi:hypothetical protein
MDIFCHWMVVYNLLSNLLIFKKTNLKCSSLLAVTSNQLILKFKNFSFNFSDEEFYNVSPYRCLYTFCQTNWSLNFKFSRLIAVTRRFRRLPAANLRPAIPSTSSIRVLSSIPIRSDCSITQHILYWWNTLDEFVGNKYIVNTIN